MPKRQTVAQFWREVEREVRAGKEAALEAGAKVLYKGTLEELKAGSPGRGRAYRRGKRKIHRASRPGETPARDDGKLIKAIGMVVNRGENPSAAVGVKTTAPYAVYLDPPRGKREPRIGRRPFLSTAFTKHEPQIKRVIADELERHLRRVGR